MGFKPKFAIPLSNMTVLGGAIANLAMNARKRHPLADRALVDWDLLVLMEPLAYTPQDLAAITTAVANFDRFRTQDRLPPAWQSHSQLLHTALRGGCGQATINFCTPHINEPDAKGFCPMHIAVGCATLAGADAELASKQIGWLLAAGADIEQKKAEMRARLYGEMATSVDEEHQKIGRAHV